VKYLKVIFKKVLSNDLAPWLLGVFGLIFSVCSYIIGKTLTKINYICVCAVVIMAHASAWYYLGKIIKKYNQLSYKDPLTSLYNKRFFYEMLELNLRCAKRSNSRLGLLLIDIDNFKNLNDTYGHISGDRALCRIAEILQEEVRESDIVARWGGDEFAIILPNTDEEKAYTVAERLRVAIERENIPHLTISVGIVSTTGDMLLDKLVCLADDALYKAKVKRNAVYFHM